MAFKLDGSWSRCLSTVADKPPAVDTNVKNTDKRWTNTKNSADCITACKVHLFQRNGGGSELPRYSVEVRHSLTSPIRVSKYTVFLFSLPCALPAFIDTFMAPRFRCGDYNSCPLSCPHFALTVSCLCFFALFCMLG